MKQISIFLFVVLCGIVVSPTVTLACGGDDHEEVREVAPKSATHATFAVEKMSCGDCAGKIRTALKGLKGVYTVNVSYKEKRVSVAFDSKSTNKTSIRKVIEELGYPARVAGNA